jgi:unspecific peroxygenase
MSIGANTTADDQLTPGLNIHGNFEGELCRLLPGHVLGANHHCRLGDASTTRGDFYFGNNFNFNETLFDQVRRMSDFLCINSLYIVQLVDAANLVGDGFLTVESVSLQKAQRINDSIARNPTLSFDTPRYLTAYAETTFPLAFFVSDQTVNTTLNGTVDDARSFFDSHKYPDGFYRRQGSYDFPEVSVMFNKTSALGPSDVELLSQ